MIAVSSESRVKMRAADTTMYRLALACLVATGMVAGARAAPPDDSSSLQARLDAASPGATVEVGPGTFAGPLRIPERVTLRGGGTDKTTVRAPGDAEAAIVLSSGAKLEQLRVEGGQTGVAADRSTSVRLESVVVSGSDKVGLRLRNSAADVSNAIVERATNELNKTGIGVSGGELHVANSIIRGWDDGLFFDKENPTRLWLEQCVLEENRDAIDLETTWARIARCRFARNRDDAIDVDGDSSCTIVACAIADSRDDGIEIRLERKTYVVIRDCAIAKSGEDGIEVISTPAALGPGPFVNRVLVEACRIARNERYGIGLSDHATEEANPQMRFPVTWRDLVFEENKRGDVAPHRSD